MRDSKQVGLDLFCKIPKLKIFYGNISQGITGNAKILPGWSGDREVLSEAIMLELFRKIFDQVDERLIPEEDRQRKLEVATCVILLEAATADSELAEEELQNIISLLKSKFQMSDSSVNELMETSKSEREKSPDLWQFSKAINETLTIDEKYELMEMIWRVIYTDGKLDKFENYIAHKLLTLLRLDHSKFIELKLKVKSGG